MGTAERRLEILKYLCQVRKATMPQLAKTFGVSIRTIQRDILALETTFHIPIDVRCGKYDGGIYIVGDYRFDRTYMHDEEIALLCKLYALAKPQLNTQENILFQKIIQNYSQTS